MMSMPGASNWIAIALLVIGTCHGQSAIAQTTSREILNEAVIVPHVGGHLPLEAEFVNHENTPIRLRQVVVGDRPTLLCLVYFECPMLCKLAADGVVRAVAGLKDDVGDSFNVAFISFDPRDSAKRAIAARNHALQQYARDDSGRGWYFLTGKQDAIDTLTKAVGFHYSWDDKTQQFAHASGLVIVSPEGTITEYLDGVRFSSAELSQALDRARQGKESASTSRSFARCYLYDPTTGKFGVAVQWTIRALGLLTVLAIVFGVYKLSRHRTANDLSDKNET